MNIKLRNESRELCCALLHFNYLWIANIRRNQKADNIPLPFVKTLLKVKESSDISKKCKVTVYILEGKVEEENH